MHHIQQWGIIFIDDDHRLFARLLVSTFHESIQSVVWIQFIIILAIEFLVWLQLQVEIMLQAISIKMLGTAHVEVEHRMLHPILLVISNGQSLEQFLSALEIGLKGRGKERLAESSRTTQKDIPHFFLSKINDVFGLIYIEIITLSDIRECLYSYRIEIYYFCHIPTCFTFCAAKLQRKSELAKHNG